MKTILLTSILTLLTSIASAVPVDSFKCKLKISVKDTKEELTQKIDINIPRRPFSYGSDQQVKYTIASTDLNTQLVTRNNHLFNTELTLSYKHATLLDNSGKVIAGAQQDCFGITADFCDKNYENCSVSRIACVHSPGDAFDPVYGWNPVLLTSNGTPLLSPSFLTSKQEKFIDNQGAVRGYVNFSCDYNGTLE